MARIRADYVFGETNAALTTSDTTLSSSSLTRLPAIASPDYAPLVLHDATAGTFEVVYVTAHTASTTTATIVRAQEGSTAAAWASGTSWLHGATSAEIRSASAGAGGSDNLGTVLSKQGVVLGLGGSGAFDEQMVESPAIMRDPKSGRYVMTYTGYDVASTRAKAGYAYSDDLVTWTKAGVLLAHSGTASAPDENGVTGPVLFWDNENDQYVLYYIGLTAVGYELGTKTICYATATSLSGTWTRHGSVVSPSGTGWRQTAVWHVSIVEREGRWYMFFNSTGNDAKEYIGYATAPSLTGPWTVDDTNSPLLSPVAATWESVNVGDPSVRRVGDMWVMDYYGYGGTSADDGIATTPDSAFPLGWTRNPDNPVLSPSETYDAKFAHKPFVMVDGGKVYHYYTAVAADDTRQIALAMSEPAASGGGLTIQDENGNVATNVTQIDFQGAGVAATAGTGEVAVTISGGGGTTGQGLVDFARAKRTSANVTINSTTLVNVDTGLDLVLSATAGDVIECRLTTRGSKDATGTTYLVFDFQTVVAGSPVNSVSTESAAGTGVANSFPAWASGTVEQNTRPTVFSGSKRYTLQAGDISGGTVTLRLRALSGAACTVAASDPMLYVEATNLGPQL